MKLLVLLLPRNGEGKFKNSYRVFQCAMIIAIVIGIITGAITYFGAGFIAGKLSNQLLLVFPEFLPFYLLL